MKTRFFRRPLATVLGAFLIGASICLAAAVFAVRSNDRTLSRPVAALASEGAAEPRISHAPPPGGAQPHIDIEVITIRPTGFERTEITRSKGLFGIAVENRSGLADIALRLDHEGGPRLGQAQLSSRKLSWKLAINLPPGRYVMTEASNPAWVCHFTITE